jgi:FG-GAP-like repeat/Tetratricopeptide repeat
MRLRRKIELRTARALLAIALAGVCVVALVGQRVVGHLAAAARENPAATARAEASAAAVSPADVQRFRNLGKAYYEQGKYDDAVAQFEKVVGAGDAFATDHLDLGLALLQDNQLNQALAELTTARDMDSKLLAVHYNLGVLYKRELRYPDAEAEFRHVSGSDPTDPASWFNLGTVCFAEKKLPEALDAFERVTAMGFGHGQNFYVAASFHVFTILTRLHRTDDAQKYLKINQEFRDKVPNISIQYPALEGGRYGAIVVPPATPAAPPPERLNLSFTDITSALGISGIPATRSSAHGGDPEAREIKSSEYSLDFARRTILPWFPTSFAVGDYDGDGHPDIYVVVPGGHNRLLRGNGKGGFTDVTEKAGVAGDGRALSAVFADYDNSGHPGLILAGLGGLTLYRNHGDGTFSDDTAKAGLAGKAGELDTRAVAFDSDSDGFLDLVVATYTDLNAAPRKAAFHFPQDFGPGETHLYRNNGDGTFRDVTANSGLASAHGRMRGALFADFNDDGYADLVLLREDGPPEFYLNQGEDRFTNATPQAGPDFIKLDAVGGAVTDFNHDGLFDIVLWSPSAYSILLGNNSGGFKAVDSPPALPLANRPFAQPGAVADVNGDGFDDLIAFDGSGTLHAVLNTNGQFREAVTAETPGGSVESVDTALVANPAKLDLLTADEHGGVRVLEEQASPRRWATVTLDGYKSNKAGVGCVVELKSGDFYQKVLATGAPLRVFTGRIARLDVIRVTWPNLIVENSIGTATDAVTNVRESERLASSCPFLYVWNGRRYVFLSDIMGVAPLGELAPDGSRVRPNPDQVVRLGDAPTARNGAITLQVTSEMRETDYFDQLRLAAVDHPASARVYANEIYSGSAAPPEIYTAGEERPLASAVDDRGHDVLGLLRDADGRYPTDFRRDRILGMADRHSLTLDLGSFPASAHPALWLTGWVFWTDSNASRALETNSKLAMIAPYLQVRDESGQWVTAIADMGLPSGTNRTFRVDLDGKFLSSDHHVRIVTSLCVYWDRIFVTLGDRRLRDPFAAMPSAAADAATVAPGDATAQPQALELPLISADLHYRGFSLPLVDTRHLHPDEFDYTRKLTDAPWNPFAGRYTRYGAVEDLITAADDRLVVMAAGDEMTLNFDVSKLPAIRSGWRRDYFLFARGYAKDGEPNTAYFRTSDPLPFYRMSNYPYASTERDLDSPTVRRYMKTYETRIAYQLIPALAPAGP